MAIDRSKFIKQFKTEIKENIQKLNQGFLRLEKTPRNRDILEKLMKVSHTIKGSSTMMGYKRIADIGHRMENGLDLALNQSFRIERILFDLFFECLDTIDALLEDKLTWEGKNIDGSYVEELCKKIDDVLSKKHHTAEKMNPEEQGGEPEKKQTGKKKNTVKKPLVSMGLEDSMRIDIHRLNKLMNLAGEMVISRIRLSELVKNLTEKVNVQKEMDQGLNHLINELKIADENIDFSVSAINSEIMDMRMVPISFLFNTFPRAMRDLAREKGKDIELTITGENTCLDKTIIDKMKDPVMHLLRNAIDHGIEEPAIRIKKNKPKTGKIVLNAYQKGSQVVIEVSDDGKGIDMSTIKQKVVNKGMVSKDKIDEMVDTQILQLLFTPGFSTKEVVTDISGRGMGLNIVREKVLDLKGMIEIISKPDSGSTFLINLPVTLAITESLLVACGNEVFALPIDTVVETVRIGIDEIRMVEAKEVITVKGHIIPLVRLDALFGISTKGIFEKKYYQVVVVQSVEKKIGLLVNKLFGRREIVAKPLGSPLQHIRNIAGGTILGDGSIVLIMDIPSIIESAEGGIIKQPITMSAPQPTKKKRKTILLAEDVLSTAMLEKNILESVGYSVIIARDGKEALKSAGLEKFDLVITDVLMPKMDGFELTAKLKQDTLYKDVPVIIVTTRQSDSDKRRGLEVGADAYILKQEFTSEILLDTIERLLG